MTQLPTVHLSSADVDGVRIHFRNAGREDGPMLLLIHGDPEMGITWCKVVAPLTAADSGS